MMNIYTSEEGIEAFGIFGGETTADQLLSWGNINPPLSKYNAQKFQVPVTEILIAFTSSHILFWSHERSIC